MPTTAHHVSSVVTHENASRSAEDRRGTTDSCRHEQQLCEIEGYLTAVTIAARQNVEHCEQALALLAAVRQHVTLSEPVWSTRLPATQHADSAIHGTPRTAHLTEREIEVLRLMADGSSNREIANTLFLSPRTVERHIANIYLKIHAHSRAEATAYARHQHLG